MVEENKQWGCQTCVSWTVHRKTRHIQAPTRLAPEDAYLLKASKTTTTTGEDDGNTHPPQAPPGRRDESAQPPVGAMFLSLQSTVPACPAAHGILIISASNRARKDLETARLGPA